MTGSPLEWLAAIAAYLFVALLLTVEIARRTPRRRK